jgi:hypothetical protein
MVLCSYILYRNNKVYYFETSLCDLLFDELGRILDTYKNNEEFHKDKENYYNIREKTYSLLYKHSYYKYLLSFKPLKLEKWFNEEDLEFITYLKQYRK